MTSDFDEFAELSQHLGELVDAGMAGHYDPDVQSAAIPKWLTDRAERFGLSGGLLLEMVRTFTVEGVDELLDNAEILNGTPEADDKLFEAKNAAWSNMWERLLADVRTEPPPQ